MKNLHFYLLVAVWGISCGRSDQKDCIEIIKQICGYDRKGQVTVDNNNSELETESDGNTGSETGSGNESDDRNNDSESKTESDDNDDNDDDNKTSEKKAEEYENKYKEICNKVNSINQSFSDINNAINEVYRKKERKILIQYDTDDNPKMMVDGAENIECLFDKHLENKKKYNPLFDFYKNKEDFENCGSNKKKRSFLKNLIEKEKSILEKIKKINDVCTTIIREPKNNKHIVKYQFYDPSKDTDIKGLISNDSDDYTLLKNLYNKEYNNIKDLEQNEEESSTLLAKLKNEYIDNPSFQAKQRPLRFNRIQKNISEKLSTTTNDNETVLNEYKKLFQRGWLSIPHFMALGLYTGDGNFASSFVKAQTYGYDLDTLKKFLYWYVIYRDCVRRLKALKQLNQISEIFVNKGKDLYRGLSCLEQNQGFSFSNGLKGHAPAILSTTDSLEIAQEGFGGNMVIKIEPTEDFATINIAPISDIKNDESEIILTLGCRYKITEIRLKNKEIS